MERIAPVLKDEERYTDEQIIEWATGRGVIAEELMPTTVSSAAGASSSNGTGAGPAPTVKSMADQYAKRNMAVMGVEELNTLIDELMAAGQVIDDLLAAARTARRAKDD